LIPEDREQLIAPCGMDCRVCNNYMAREIEARSKGLRMAYCTGCRARDKQCAYLKKRCALIGTGVVRYCCECPNFPCDDLKYLDNKYRRMYKSSLIENLETIKTEGISKLLENQEAKWKCPDCGGTICCHNGICFTCGLEKLKNKRKVFRWED